MYQITHTIHVGPAGARSTAIDEWTESFDTPEEAAARFSLLQAQACIEHTVLIGELVQVAQSSLELLDGALGDRYPEVIRTAAFDTLIDGIKKISDHLVAHSDGVLDRHDMTDGT